jgi:hypothetical protein
MTVHARLRTRERRTSFRLKPGARASGFGFRPSGIGKIDIPREAFIAAPKVDV